MYIQDLIDRDQPKKIIAINICDKIHYICPTCLWENDWADTRDEGYCTFCGQRLRLKNEVKR